jgi:hypothetical protein
MNSKLSLVFAACVYFMISCSSQNESESATRLQNLELVKNIRSAIDSNQLNKLDQYIASDAIDHDGDRGYMKGLDSIKMQMQKWHSEAEEKIEVIRELADDDYVMSWIKSNGKYLTTGQGHKPGDTFTAQMVSITKVANGKAVEHWMMMPPTDVIQMMASTTAPAVQTAKELRPDSLIKKKAAK